ncbi:uncharacterized protein VTP21DRAFT_11309 [Calcarisporiella thermophila]|uniref:uncharacterized protein n=1 Tax=Calcarisporiella thermophila TaxID=911321 RepID=UPI003742794D
MTDSFGDRIANICLEQYKKLPKNGKPQVQGSKVEWTVLAGIVEMRVDDNGNEILRCISLGTGVKCQSFRKLVRSGDLVHDCHAEVLSRRGFNCYLINEARKAITDASEVLQLDNKASKFLFRIKSGVSYHLYISQSPCGDASMTPLALAQTEEAAAEFLAQKKRTLPDWDYLEKQTYSNKRLRVQQQTNPKQTKDGLEGCAESKLYRGRYGYEALGVLRTKPGRVDSEPTLSMSCSDKIARWNVLGLCSAIVNLVIEPVYLTTIVVGEMFDEPSLTRALSGRIKGIQDLPIEFKVNCPRILSTNAHFESSKDSIEGKHPDLTLTTSNTALCWVTGWPSPQVLINGRKQGAKPNREGIYPAKTRPILSKISLANALLDLLVLMPSGRLDFRIREWMEESKTKTYEELKRLARDYQIAKDCLLTQRFAAWVQTPDEFNQWTLDSVKCESTSKAFC